MAGPGSTEATELDQLIANAKTLRLKAEAKAGEIAAAIKKQEATTPGDGRPGPEVRRLARELGLISARLRRATQQLQNALGVTDQVLDAADRAKLPKYDDRWWRHQIVETPPSQYIDEVAPQALERLLQRVDPVWLEEQSTRAYRLGADFLSTPLHLVGGARLPRPGAPAAPQRFAHMLLVARDHVMKRDDLDFFAAAEFIPELTVLGRRLDLIPSLGTEAVRKLDLLPTLTDDEVCSTIYELTVGTACVLKGRRIEMLPASPSKKSPDFRLLDLGVPAVVECKRRRGLAEYELTEAETVERLYEPLREIVKEKGLHGSLETRFRVPVDTVHPDEFVRVASAILTQSADTETFAVPWGELAYSRLPLTVNTPDTRLYSPDFLQQVFGWSSLDNDWDGLLCEVEAPQGIRVRSARLPSCLKWRSDSPKALTTKSRGVTSLWAKAAKQIPAGEVGFVYIAYPEGQRGELADARTREIIASSGEHWYHRWSIRIPLTVIGRIYARPLGAGVPDFIESALPGVSPGEEHWLEKLPGRVFLGP